MNLGDALEVGRLFKRSAKESSVGKVINGDASIALVAEVDLQYNQ